MEIADYIIADDRVLVELVLQGDNIAFEYLFERYKEAIHRLFHTAHQQPPGRRRPAAGNLHQSLYQHPPLQPGLHLRQWVYTIARNTFVDFIRRRQEDLPIDDKFTAPPSNNPHAPKENIIRKQQRTQIERYLQAMPPRYRQLIVMRFFEEYSYEEIAMKLELPLGTVKTQIHRAREQMCRLIAADEKS